MRVRILFPNHSHRYVPQIKSWKTWFKWKNIPGTPFRGWNQLEYAKHELSKHLEKAGQSVVGDDFMTYERIDSSGKAREVKG